MRDALLSVVDAYHADLETDWKEWRHDVTETPMSSVLGCGLQKYYQRIHPLRKEFDLQGQLRMCDGLRAERNIIQWLLNYSEVEQEVFKGPLRLLRINRSKVMGKATKIRFYMLDDGKDRTEIKVPELEMAGHPDAYLVDKRGEIIVADAKTLDARTPAGRAFGEALKFMRKEIRAGRRDSYFDWLWNEAPRPPSGAFQATAHCGQIAAYVEGSNLYLVGGTEKHPIPITKGVLVYKYDHDFFPIVYDSREYDFLPALVSTQAGQIRDAVCTGDTSKLYVNKNPIMCRVCPYADVCDAKIKQKEKTEWVIPAGKNPEWTNAILEKLAAAEVQAEHKQAHDILRDLADAACPAPKAPGEKCSIKVKVEDAKAIVQYTKTYKQEVRHELTEADIQQGFVVTEKVNVTDEDKKRGYVVLAEADVSGRLAPLVTVEE